MIEIEVEKIEKVFVSIEQIEAYMKFKGWTVNPGGGYRTPCEKRECIILQTGGEQLTVKAIAAFEHRPSYNVALDIIAFAGFISLQQQQKFRAETEHEKQ